MRIASRALLTSVLLSLTVTAHALPLTFDFQFDKTFDTTLTPPIVGTGTVDLANDPGDGTFAFTSLAPTMAFTFGSITFTNADIKSVPADVKLVLSTTAQGRRLQFSDTGSGGGGPENGSLDFGQAGTFLSFEPSNFGQGLNEYQTTAPNGTLTQGTYRGLVPSNPAVPEPSTLALLGAAALPFARWRRRQR